MALTSTSNGRAESTVTRLPDDGYWTNEEIKVENRVTASVDPNRPDYANYVYKAVLHELVHGLRLDDAYGCAPGQTVMNPILGVNDSGGGLPMQVTEFDRGLIAQQYLDPLPDPGPLPPCNPSWEPDQVQAECDVSCDCHTDSPLLINLSGGGLHLTSVEAGVAFDMDGDGILEQVAWTTSGSEQAFLVLDRNGNGEIDSGFELFGTHTEQAPTFNPNGFAALALLDQPEYGGNGDNYISAAGRAFASLRLWIDANHDGRAQPQELVSLPAAGISRISLNYTAASRIDRFGNYLRYKSRARTVRRGYLTVWDVYLRYRPDALTGVSR